MSPPIHSQLFRSLNIQPVKHWFLIFYTQMAVIGIDIWLQPTPIIYFTSIKIDPN